MIGSEQHFRDTLGAERAGHLLAALKTGSSRARALAVDNGFVEMRTEPTVAFDLSIKALIDFEDFLGVRRALSLGQHLWVIDETYALRVKKMTNGYRTANHSSKQQAKISSFQPLDGMEPLVYLTAGTRYSTSTGLAEEWVVVKHLPGPIGNQQVEWVCDLESLASGDTAATTPTLGFPTAPAAPAAVRRRRPAETEALPQQ